jgi:hypothetical protein
MSIVSLTIILISTAYGPLLLLVGSLALHRLAHRNILRDVVLLWLCILVHFLKELIVLFFLVLSVSFVERDAWAFAFNPQSFVVLQALSGYL